MNTKDKILVCLFALCTVILAPFITLSVIATLRFIELLGVVTMVFIILCTGCVSLLMVSFTFSRIGLWNAKKQRAWNSTNIIVAGDIVVHRLPDGSISNLSADIEKARAIAGPREIEAGPMPGNAADDETVIQLYIAGIGVDTIARKCRMSKLEVQRIIGEKG